MSPSPAERRKLLTSLFERVWEQNGAITAVKPRSVFAGYFRGMQSHTRHHEHQGVPKAGATGGQTRDLHLASPDEAIGVLGLVPIALGLGGLWLARRADADEDVLSERQVMTTTGVAGITIANGADNIAIYAPLFATVGSGDTAITLIVFAVLVAAWCMAGGLIGSRPPVIRAVDWAGHYAIPFVLIALGIFIVAESWLVGTLLD